MSDQTPTSDLQKCTFCDQLLDPSYLDLVIYPRGRPMRERWRETRHRHPRHEGE